MSNPLPARELQLLFLLLGEAWRDEELIEFLEDGVDWRYFCWLAAQERAGSVVHRRLRALPAGLVPGDAAVALERLAVVTEFRMSRLRERLVETVAALRAADIEVILLKGAGLANTVYPAFSDRPMVDLDLLVREERGAEAWEVARRTGWVWDHEEELDRFYAEHHHFPPLWDAGGTSFGLELHTALFSAGHPFDLPLELLWETAEPVPGWGEGVYVLGLHPQILHLCLHFSWSHMLASGSWRTFRDLRVLLGTGWADWEEFVELAVAARAATCSYWALRLARGLAGVEVPNEALDQLAPPGGELLLRTLERHYLAELAPLPGGGCPADRVREMAWEFGIRPGWSGHGASRPWSRTPLYMAALAGVESGADDVGAGGAGGVDGASGTGIRTGSIGARVRRQFANYRSWLRYLGLVTGISSRVSLSVPFRASASRRAISSSRGRSASASSGRTLPLR